MCMREGGALVISLRSRAAGSDLLLCDPDIFGDVLAGRADVQDAAGLCCAP
jgi:hypothetical protein